MAIGDPCDVKDCANKAVELFAFDPGSGRREGTVCVEHSTAFRNGTPFAWDEATGQILVGEDIPDGQSPSLFLEP